MRAILIMLAFALANSGMAHGQRLHALLVADTDTGGKIGVSVRTDIKNLRTILEAGLPAARLRITEITGNAVTPNNLTSRLRNLQINSDDAVIIYYSGHGGFDPNRGHYFALTNGGRLYRSAVVSAITQPYTPRFWGVITDCCASIPPIAVAPILAPGDRTTLLTHLFLETRGRVDFTSSRPEQISLGIPPPIGGLFTWSLCKVLDENANQRLQWDDVFRLTRAETADFSEGFMAKNRDTHIHNGITQRTQIPYSFRTMYGKDVNGLRLGMSSQGMVVTSVRSQSPASRAGLRSGMRVIRVNGTRVSSDRQIATAINFSTRTATLDVESNGVGRTINVRLAY